MGQLGYIEKQYCNDFQKNEISVIEPPFEKFSVEKEAFNKPNQSKETNPN